MQKRRVVITGMGTVNPIGNSVQETYEGLLQGRNGIGPITRYPVEDRTITIAAEVKGLDLDRYIPTKEQRRMDLYTAYGLVAAKQALEDSGLDPASWADSTRHSVVMSSGIGGLGTMQEEVIRGKERGYDKISPFFIPKAISNMGAGVIAMELGIHGEVTCPVTACAGGNNAIGQAFRNIRDGYLDVVFAGGSEAAITEVGMGGFTSMRALASSNDPHRASIPFDKERNGFVMGEGAAMLVLEELEQALARGARIYAEVVGYGMSCDAYHITSPDPDGRWAAAAMSMAIEDAGVAPTSITSVNAHGTSTELNDACETMAIKRVWGELWDQVLVNGTKSMTGHLLGAAGAVEAVIAALELQHDFLAPTINVQVPDPECDLTLVTGEAMHTEVHYVLSNSLGFGGHNYSLLFKKWSPSS